MGKIMTTSKVFYIKDQHDYYFNVCDEFSEGFIGDIFNTYDNRKVFHNKKEIKESLEYIKMYFPNHDIYIEEVITKITQKKINIKKFI
jgi:hypothetical protein